MMLKKTKIVASISDLRCDVDFIRDLFNAGMNVVRMNTAHASREGFEKLIANVREVSNRIAILMDTKGPEVRTTKNAEDSTEYKTGDRVKIIGDPTKDTVRGCIYVSYPGFVNDLTVGARVLIDDGELELEVVDKDSEAWVESLIVPLVTDAYGDFPDTFKAKTMPELVDLKTDEPDIYWGMVTLAYLRATNTDIYGEGAEGASRRIITELNSLLAGLYPEKAAAREAADNLLDWPAPRNLCGLLFYCTALFRHYAESNYKSEASKELLLLGCGKRSYWLEPDCDYKPGRDVWLLTEQSLGRMTPLSFTP